MIHVRALAVTAEKQTGFFDLQTPELGFGEALVKVRAVALCTLEQRVFRGAMKLPLPFIGGHEVAGDVVALGEGADADAFPPGTRVAVRLFYACGLCSACRSGQSNMCDHAKQKPVREGLLPGPGGLVDQVIVPVNMLFKVSDALSYEEASLTEPLACCVHSVNRAGIRLGEDVVVIGGGVMGQLHVMLAKLRGARVLMSEPMASRRKTALALGADIAIDPTQEDPVAAVRAWTDGEMSGVVFNTTADSDVFAQAFLMAGKGGRLVQYSSLHPDVPASISPQLIHAREVTITGAVSPMLEDFATASRLLNLGIIKVDRLISAVYPFAEGQRAFEAAIKPDMLRVVVKL